MRSCQASSKKASSVRESPLQKTPYGVAAAGPTALSARADGTAAGAWRCPARPRVSSAPRAPEQGRGLAHSATRLPALPGGAFSEYS